MVNAFGVYCERVPGPHRRPMHPSIRTPALKVIAIGRHAVVVAEPLAFGLVRMYEQMSESVVKRAGMRIFRDMSAAEAWLGS